MGQVLTLLQLAVAEPLRILASVISIDVPALLIHFECLGFDHSYYRAWSVAAPQPPLVSHQRRWDNSVGGHGGERERGRGREAFPMASHRACAAWARLAAGAHATLSLSFGCR